jgi:hypothetical protein
MQLVASETGSRYKCNVYETEVISYLGETDLAPEYIYQWNNETHQLPRDPISCHNADLQTEEIVLR